MAWNLPIRAVDYDFQELATRDPALTQYFTGPHFDFENSQAVRALTECILKLHHGITIETSSANLCPRIPNRYIYCCWIKQVLGYTFLGPVTGLDIGTGAYCIYPLLACSMSDWSFYASEVNDSSLEAARHNLALNLNFQGRISLMRPFPGKILRFEQLSGSTFTMCNPPFFDPQDRRDIDATDSELYFAGGEAAFIKQYIDESKGFSSTWYTTMVGKFLSLGDIVEHLKDAGIANWGLYLINPNLESKSFVRWIVAWSYDHWHIPDFLGHCPGAKYKGLNGLTSVVRMKVVQELILGQLDKYLQELDHCGLVNGQYITLTVPGDVWSRKYRREKKRKTEDTKVIFQLRVSDGELCVYWQYGSNEKVFESFVGYIQRWLRQNKFSGQKTA